MQRDALTLPAPPLATQAGRETAWRPRPHLYLCVLALWIGAVWWFHTPLVQLLDLGTTIPTRLALGFFVVFIHLGWIYAAYNVSVIAFGSWLRWRGDLTIDDAPAHESPPVALLYTTCNDFSEEAVRSCLAQDYEDWRLYVLDDSTDPEWRARVDDFAAAHPGRVQVVRRGDRRGFKAGNLNHALRAVAREPLFALVDADEILPPDFLRRLVPRLLAMQDCAFIQANHHANPRSASPLARDLGAGVNSHWRWYHPIRNEYGFVMLLGHGALVRRQAWLEIGGFPEIVSEDLGFALRAREAGWHGWFAEDVICYEEFPADVRAFRVRHMKWTRGTCEFLAREAGGLLRSRRISWVEKLDILLPTLNLPLSLLFFLFVIDANVILTSLFGNVERLTWVIGGEEWHIPVLRLDPGFSVLNRADLLFVTLLALFSPVLCFLIDMWRRPRELSAFLARSTALYGALGPLSSIGVLLFAATRSAVFHVTADRGSGAPSPDATGHVALAEARPANAQGPAGRGVLSGLREELRSVALRSHPDHPIVQATEIAIALTLMWLAWRSMQITFLGLAFAYLLLPILHHARWESRLVQVLVTAPLTLVTTGVFFGTLSLFGVQTVFYGFGFHF